MMDLDHLESQKTLIEIVEGNAFQNTFLIHFLMIQFHLEYQNISIFEGLEEEEATLSHNHK